MPEPRRLEPLTHTQKRLFVFLSAASFFEGFDFMAITQVLPNLREAMHLSPSQTGLLVGVVNIGPILAVILVRNVDAWGRRRVMQLSLSGYALCSLLTGLAPEVYSFAIFQLLARMFLIGEWATSMVYAAEAFPASRRGQAVGTIQAMGSLGAVICAGIVPLLVHTSLGWRAVYFFGAIPITFLIFARRNLAETERFQQVVKTGHQRKSFLEVVRGPTRRRVLQLGALWFLVYVGTHNATTFWKEYAVSERGWTDAQVASALTAAALISLPLIFGVGRLMDVLGRRGGAAIIYPLAGIGVLLSFTLHGHLALTVALTLVIFGAASVLPVVEAYTSELFPTELRGDGFAWANNLIGRFGPVISPAIIGRAAEVVGWGPAVAVTGLANFLALGLILAVLPETASRELEEINARTA